MPDHIIGLPIFLDPDESLLYTTMPEASSESAFEIESDSNPKENYKLTSSIFKEGSPTCNLKRTPTLRRQIIAPPPLPPIHPASSPIMTRRNPKIPPAMPASFVPSSSPSIIPSRQTFYQERSSSTTNRKDRHHRNKSPSHRHKHKSIRYIQSQNNSGCLIVPVQPPIYSSGPMIMIPKQNNHSTIYSNRFFEKDDEPYEVKPLIYSGFNRPHLSSPIYGNYQKFNKQSHGLNIISGPNNLLAVPIGSQPVQINQDIYQRFQGIYNNHPQQQLLLQQQRPVSNQAPFIQNRNGPKNTSPSPIYQSQPQIYSSGVYASQNQIYSNLQPHQIHNITSPPPIYSNFNLPDFNMHEPETYLIRTNLQGETCRPNASETIEYSNPNTPMPIFGGLSKRLKNVFHGFKI